MESFHYAASRPRGIVADTTNLETLMPNPIYKGVFPVAPTIFDDAGRLDLDGQRRAIDFMIDAGSHGICILANFSEPPSSK